MSNPRGRIAAALFVFCSSLFGISCGHRETPKQYPFHGTVVSVDPDAKVASIHNEDIAGWMSAMTMEYPFQNRAELESLHPGDRIDATVNVTDDRYWLTNIHKSPGL